MKAETASKTQLAIKYKVSYNTFIKWLRMIPELELNPKKRLLTPKQVQIVYNHLGEP